MNTDTELKTEVKLLNDNKVLLCLTPGQRPSYCQRMTRKELANVRDTINEFFSNKNM